MRIEINKKDNKEKFTEKCEHCEECDKYYSLIVGNSLYLEETLDIKKRKQEIECYCDECEDCSHHSLCNHRTIFEGNIGDFFLEFISMDFKKIKEDAYNFLKTPEFTQRLNTKLLTYPSAGISKFEWFDEKSGDRIHKEYNLEQEARGLHSQEAGEYVTLKYLTSIHPLFKLNSCSPCEGYERQYYFPDGISNLHKFIDFILQPFECIKALMDYWFIHKDFYSENILQVMSKRGISCEPEPKILNPRIIKNKEVYFDAIEDEIKRYPSNKIVEMLMKESKITQKLADTVYYFAYNITEVFGVFINYVIDKGYKIKKCENCKKYFVPYTRSDTKYCSRHSPQDKTKTCAEYSKYQKQLEREKNNDCTKAYKSLYNTLRNKMLRNEPDFCTYNYYANLMIQLQYENQNYKKKLSGKIITEKEYLDWINKFREKINNGADT